VVARADAQRLAIGADGALRVTTVHGQRPEVVPGVVQIRGRLDGHQQRLLGAVEISLGAAGDPQVQERLRLAGIRFEHRVGKHLGGLPVLSRRGRASVGDDDRDLLHRRRVPAPAGGREAGSHFLESLLVLGGRAQLDVTRGVPGARALDHQRRAGQPVGLDGYAVHSLHVLVRSVALLVPDMEALAVAAGAARADDVSRGVRLRTDAGRRPLLGEGDPVACAVRREKGGVQDGRQSGGQPQERRIGSVAGAVGLDAHCAGRHEGGTSAKGTERRATATKRQYSAIRTNAPVADPTAFRCGQRGLPASARSVRVSAPRWRAVSWPPRRPPSVPRTRRAC